jgi:LmbE family N-acetylglucosaminyl deacetylase
VMYPPNSPRNTKKQEVIDALRVLGVSPDSLSFFDLPDQQIPAGGSPEFPAAVEALRMVISEFAPSTVIVPWRRDRHYDHEATWQIAQEAAAQAQFRGRWMEYAAWLVDPGDHAAFPEPGEMDIFRFDISPVFEQKRAAIACHRSWTIDQADGDHPTSFRFTESALGRDNVPWEVFLESYDE